MNAVAVLPRILLGLIFVTFGANGFLHFLPMPLPSGQAGDFMALLAASHFAAFVFGVQFVAGVLVLTGRFEPLGLALLAPVIANILVFHLTMEPGGIAPGLIALALWLARVYRDRRNFLPIVRPPARS